MSRGPLAFPVWDCHVHGYPTEVIVDPREWARRQAEPHWCRLVTEGPQGWADPEEMLRAMDRDGVEKVLLQAWYWENPDTARRQNDWHADWVSRYPGRVMACAAFHPGVDDPVGMLEEARQWGAVGVGECLPQVQSSGGWSDEGWQEMLRWTSGAGWPVFLHLTEPAGHVYPGRVETPLMEILALFEAHPEQNWVCAHWGGGLPFYALNRRVRKALKRVWFDTAASPLLYDPRIWRSLTDLLGAEKFLFGSDFPLILYPRQEASPGWGRLLEEFAGSGLDAAQLRAIASNNLRSILPQ